MEYDILVKFFIKSGFASLRTLLMLSDVSWNIANLWEQFGIFCFLALDGQKYFGPSSFKNTFDPPVAKNTYVWPNKGQKPFWTSLAYTSHAERD